MSFDNKEFRRTILNYRIKCEHEKNFRFFICIFKIGSIETVELMFNFDEKNSEKNCNQRLVIEELLKNFISPDNWYFVLSLNIEKVSGIFLYNSVIRFKLQKKHDD